MKITLIHKAGCPLCETAIREFTGDGHDVELREEWEFALSHPSRARDMMADMQCAGGDKDIFPQVFIYDRYVPWQPKSAKGRVTSPF